MKLKMLFKGITNAIPYVASIKNDIKEGKNVFSVERLIETISIIALAIAVKKMDISVDLLKSLFSLF